jgi:hypothetical protein
MTRSSPLRSTCAFYLGINLEDLKSEEGYTHQPNCAALVRSADSCRLCGVIVAVLKRSIHIQRRQTSPYKTIADVGYLGPLRLFAAARDVDSQNLKRRKKGPVKEQLLSNVTIVAGEVISHKHPAIEAMYFGNSSYGSLSPKKPKKNPPGCVCLDS